MLTPKNSYLRELGHDRAERDLRWSDRANLIRVMPAEGRVNVLKPSASGKRLFNFAAYNTPEVTVPLFIGDADENCTIETPHPRTCVVLFISYNVFCHRRNFPDDP